MYLYSFAVRLYLFNMKRHMRKAFQNQDAIKRLMKKLTSMKG